MTLLRHASRSVPVLFTLLAGLLPASAQDILGVDGTWEMIGADNAQVDEYTLVFYRATFAGDRLRTTSIYLDGDDGELTARTTEASFFESAGQLIVRDAGRSTVLDVGRTLDGLVIRDTQTDITLRLRAADPAAALDPALVGSWTGAGDGHTWAFHFTDDGQAFVRRDGADRDDARRYTVASAYLIVGDDAYSFNVLGDRLTLYRQDQAIDLTRAEARPEASAPLAN